MKPAKKTAKNHDLRSDLSAALGQERREGLTRQVGGQGIFADKVAEAIRATEARNFACHAEAVAFARVDLVQRCGSRPTEADLAAMGKK